MNKIANYLSLAAVAHVVLDSQTQCSQSADHSFHKTYTVVKIGVLDSLRARKNSGMLFVVALVAAYNSGVETFTSLRSMPIGGFTHGSCISNGERAP